MENIFWTAVSAAQAAIGITLVLRGRTRSWRLAGFAYALGGACNFVYSVIYLAGAFDPPIDFTAVDVAVLFGVVGFFATAGAMVATLVAIGRTGRRRFLVVFAASLLTIGTYEFWTSNWAARTGAPADRCVATGHQSFGSTTPRIERVPPGVWCPEQRSEVFVPADAICWLALVGWSTFWALLATYTIMGAGWALRRRPTLRAA